MSSCWRWFSWQSPPKISASIKRQSRQIGGFFFSAALGLSVQLFFCRGLSRYAACCTPEMAVVEKSVVVNYCSVYETMNATTQLIVQVLIIANDIRLC
jgi:hypothetical protein